MDKKISKLILVAIAVAAIGIAVYLLQKPTVIAPTKDQPAQDTASTTANGANATTTGNPDASITSFEQCLAAGYPVTGEKPHRKCLMSDYFNYIEVEACTAPSGESMNVYEAARVFDSSQCGLEGSAKESRICNETTGTWQVGILTYRKGCDPVCVIDVKTKKAEIDWRCTGGTAQ